MAAMAAPRLAEGRTRCLRELTRACTFPVKMLSKT